MLLAVDLGVRTAWALYDPEGHLCRFESRNFGNRTRMRSGVPTVVRTLPQVEVVVAEGDARLAKFWFGCRKDWETELVSAQTWRRDILTSRQRRSGSKAKAEAVDLAAKVIQADQCGRSEGLNDDTAEAILLGYWAVTSRGWRMDSLF